jgi:hypothetical protein
MSFKQFAERAEALAAQDKPANKSKAVPQANQPAVKLDKAPADTTPERST